MKSRRSESGQDSPLPFLRQPGFSAAYNGAAKPEKSRGRLRAGATRKTPASDKDHSVGAGVSGPIMTPTVISP
ncbi:conserved domain protein [Actinomyces sp. oral taxon 170 str. F0386]|nr:conserved domain protein [Actinomyces sp. oral taxon 170 str. F0386]